MTRREIKSCLLERLTGNETVLKCYDPIVSNAIEEFELLCKGATDEEADEALDNFLEKTTNQILSCKE
jgi:hypothetical protein